MFTKMFVPVFGRRIDLKDAIIKIKDGSTTPKTLEIKLGDGDFSYTERRNIEYIMDRGLIDDVREGDQVPVQAQFDATWDYIIGPSSASTGVAGTPTIEDALKARGGAADWISTDSDQCRPYCVDLEITINPQPAGCGDQETILLSEFRYEEIGHGLRQGNLSISGQCHVTEATPTRVAGS